MCPPPEPPECSLKDETGGYPEVLHERKQVKHRTAELTTAFSSAQIKCVDQYFPQDPARDSLSGVRTHRLGFSHRQVHYRV